MSKLPSNPDCILAPADDSGDISNIVVAYKNLNHIIAYLDYAYLGVASVGCTCNPHCYSVVYNTQHLEEVEEADKDDIDDPVVGLFIGM